MGVTGLDPNVMFQMGYAGTYDPSKSKVKRRENVNAMLMALGNTAISYWQQGQENMGEMKSESRPLIKSLDENAMKANVLENSGMDLSIKKLNDDLDEGQKLMNKYRLFKGGDNYQRGEELVNNANLKIANLSRSLDDYVTSWEESKLIASGGAFWETEDGQRVAKRWNSGSSAFALRNSQLMASGNLLKHTFTDDKTGELMVWVRGIDDPTTEKNEAGEPLTIAEHKKGDVAMKLSDLEFAETEDPNGTIFYDAYKVGAINDGNSGVELTGELHDAKKSQFFTTLKNKDSRGFKSALFGSSYTLDDGQVVSTAEAWVLKMGGFKLENGKMVSLGHDFEGNLVDGKVVDDKSTEDVDESTAFIGAMDLLKQVDYSVPGNRTAMGEFLWEDIVSTQNTYAKEAIAKAKKESRSKGGGGGSDKTDISLADLNWANNLVQKLQEGNVPDQIYLPGKDGDQFIKNNEGTWDRVSGKTGQIVGGTIDLNNPATMEWALRKWGSQDDAWQDLIQGAFHGEKPIESGYVAPEKYTHEDFNKDIRGAVKKGGGGKEGDDVDVIKYLNAWKGNLGLGNKVKFSNPTIWGNSVKVEIGGKSYRYEMEEKGSLRGLIKWMEEQGVLDMYTPSGDGSKADSKNWWGGDKDTKGVLD